MTLETSDSRTARPNSRAMKLLLVMLAVTCVLSLVYAIQYYAGGPVRLPVAVGAKDLAFQLGTSQLAVAANDGTVRLWAIDQDWSERILRGHSDVVVGVAFSPDGTTLVSAGHDGTVRVWDVATGQSRAALNDNSGPLNGASLAADGSLYATIGDDGIVRIWDLAAGQVIRRIGPGDNTKHVVALSADGSLVAAGDGSNIQVWGARTGEVLVPLEGYWEDPETEKDWVGHKKEVTALAFSPDGKVLASGATDATCFFWDLETGEVKWAAEGHWGAVTHLVFSQDGKTVLSGSSDTKVRSFRIPGGAFVAVYQGHLSSVNGLAFGPTADSLFSAGDDGTVRQWETLNQKVTRIEWIQLGYQPQWGKLLAAWALVSGLIGLLCLWGLRKLKAWSHLLALALFLIGPIVVLGLPFFEVFPYPLVGAFVRISFFLINILLLLAALVGLLILGYNAARGRLPSLGRALALLLALVLLAVLYYLKVFPLGHSFRLGQLITTATEPEMYTLPIQLKLSWPLLLLIGWYAVLVLLLMREEVAQRYQAADSLPLAQWLMASRRTNQARLGIFGLAVWLFILVLLYSVLRRFNLDVAFMGHWFRFIMEGAGVTFYISAASILLAVVLALLGALGHLSKNPIANGVSSFYISLIRGTPLLVQIYIWYLGLPRLDIVLPATLAGILALGVNYGAYMSEIFRAGIQAIGKGQHEAAHALGMSQAQTFRRIVLPQAFRIVIPPIGNEFIAMMKDSALVSVMAVWELSYRAGKVGRQYFRSLETFIVAAAFYWVLTVIFQFLQGKLETYMGRSERR
jgi:polar amino acid transport system permease protein